MRRHHERRHRAWAASRISLGARRPQSRRYAGSLQTMRSFAAAAEAATADAATDFQTAFRVPLLKGVIAEVLDLALQRDGDAR